MQVTGLNETIAAIQEEANALTKQAKNATKLAGQAYANDVKALAPISHGKGPHGLYRKSIHVEPKILDEDGRYYAIVGTDLPQARRLEYGFYDMVDSLGRHYWQLPQPHFRPPLDTEIDKYVAIMKGALASDFGTYDASLGRMIGSAMAQEGISE